MCWTNDLRGKINRIKERGGLPGKTKAKQEWAKTMSQVERKWMQETVKREIEEAADTNLPREETRSWLMAVGSHSGREGGWTLLDEENEGGEIMVDRGRAEIKERVDIRWQKWRSRGGALPRERKRERWINGWWRRRKYLIVQVRQWAGQDRSGKIPQAL